MTNLLAQFLTTKLDWVSTILTLCADEFQTRSKGLNENHDIFLYLKFCIS